MVQCAVIYPLSILKAIPSHWASSPLQTSTRVLSIHRSSRPQHVVVHGPSTGVQGRSMPPFLQVAPAQNSPKREPVSAHSDPPQSLSIHPTAFFLHVRPQPRFFYAFGLHLVMAHCKKFASCSDIFDLRGGTHSTSLTGPSEITLGRPRRNRAHVRREERTFAHLQRRKFQSQRRGRMPKEEGNLTL